MDGLVGIVRELTRSTKAVNRITTNVKPTWIYLDTPLTSASWDGDAYSTTAKTVIDLSAVFAVPASVRAILVQATAYDSGSQASNNCFFILGPDNTAAEGMWLYLNGLPNNYFHGQSMVVPCDANGDVYYQLEATGAGSMHVYLWIYGYYI